MEKQKFYKRKAIIFPAVLIMSLVIVVAAVLVATINVDVTVNEAISTALVPISVGGFPNEVITESLAIANAGSNPIDVTITFTETGNLDLVNYTSNTPFVVTLAPGPNSVDVSWTIDSSSPVGVFEGDITIQR